MSPIDPTPSLQAAPARARPPYLAMLSALLVLVALVIWVDLPLTRLLQSETSPEVDDAFEDIGDLAATNFFVFSALAVYGFSLWALRRGLPARLIGYDRLARGSLLVILTMAAGGIITGLLKQIVARARPDVFFANGFYGLGEPFSGDPFNSFPSSHTLTAFAVAAALAQAAPRWRWPLFAMAALIGLSRLVNLDHYLSDVLVAATVAILAARWLAPRVLDPRHEWVLRAPWAWRRRG
ncbi:phosphatase PAP2 family protein [Orrella dioscoreae]|uniref:Phosphatidylglycerophosphatase B n=1 Tax=Orrella dioscoreae TaxID=1851544 RepID=A0A1C3JZ42_9BURK|nr:phosphatase PAP2 family protein [Orrella dioscoreae]SBT24428.1 Phosphatidylglycerophosphatase B [Orrella dioscoreae]SOE52224.1 Phosphatidylglycerophosphatase B [Orrella dioscoreae]